MIKYMKYFERITPSSAPWGGGQPDHKRHTSQRSSITCTQPIEDLAEKPEEDETHDMENAVLAELPSLYVVSPKTDKEHPIHGAANPRHALIPLVQWNWSHTWPPYDDSVSFPEVDEKRNRLSSSRISPTPVVNKETILHSVSPTNIQWTKTVRVITPPLRVGIPWGVKATAELHRSPERLPSPGPSILKTSSPIKSSSLRVQRLDTPAIKPTPYLQKNITTFDQQNMFDWPLDSDSYPPFNKGYRSKFPEMRNKSARASLPPATKLGYYADQRSCDKDADLVKRRWEVKLSAIGRRRKKKDYYSKIIERKMLMEERLAKAWIEEQKEGEGKGKEGGRFSLLLVEYNNIADDRWSRR
ncbi:uncharacterized protein IL334_000456 [Kwoniella shivajii]|uniref:BZIP domain-containing protein n=1 Tax=Kwoniella shivajii TaxID=564305 RepID=A0ABZ1CP77_9TREE|nr:hypothetical protein IL334_000456 [Kwoniella shivajii]